MDYPRIARVVLVAVVAVVGLLGLRSAIVWKPTAAAERAGERRLAQADLDAGFHFAPGVIAGDRQAVEAAVAAADPQARRLIGLVDGLVDISVGNAGPGAAGVTAPRGKRYDVVLDLAGVGSRLGPRGVSRLVLHELGHVIDDVLVPPGLKQRLDDGIPRGWGCEEGVTGSCAIREERFAESFAKWAMNDIGADINIGYKVPPPRLTLAEWARPLTRLRD